MFRSCFHGEFWGFTADQSIAVVVRADLAGPATVELPDPSGEEIVEIQHGAFLPEAPVCQGTGITATTRYRLDSVDQATAFTGEISIGADRCPSEGSVVLEHLLDQTGETFVSPLVLRGGAMLGCVPD